MKAKRTAESMFPAVRFLRRGRRPRRSAFLRFVRAHIMRPQRETHPISWIGTWPAPWQRAAYLSVSLPAHRSIHSQSPQTSRRRPCARIPRSARAHRSLQSCVSPK